MNGRPNKNKEALSDWTLTPKKWEAEAAEHVNTVWLGLENKGMRCEQRALKAGIGNQSGQGKDKTEKELRESGYEEAMASTSLNSS